MKLNQTTKLLLEKSLDEVKWVYEQEEEYSDIIKSCLTLIGNFIEVLNRGEISKRSALILRDFYTGQLKDFETVESGDLSEEELNILYEIKEESELCIVASKIPERIIGCRLIRREVGIAVDQICGVELHFLKKCVLAGDVGIERDVFFT